MPVMQKNVQRARVKNPGSSIQDLASRIKEPASGRCQKEGGVRVSPAFIF